MKFSFRKTTHLLLLLIFLIVFIGAVFYFTNLIRENEAIKAMIASYGYFGIFIVAAISGFNLAVPIPAVAFLPLFLESGLNFWISLLIITIGVTTADIVAYFVGKLSFEVTAETTESKILKKLISIRERHRQGPAVALFIFAAFAPLPNELMILPMGFLGYRLIHILPPVILGNFIFNLLYSISILRVFELI